MLAGVQSIALAADPETCRDYARLAVEQFHNVQERESCHYLFREESSRWTGDFRAHFEWCRGVDHEAVRYEREVRAHRLEDCMHRHRDWREHEDRRDERR